MLYALLIHAPESDTPPDPAVLEKVMARHRAVQDETRAAGNYVGSFRLSPSKTARTVQLGSNGPLVTDGPFAETKELLAGFYLIECTDDAEAARHAELLCGSPHDRVEIRPVMWRSDKPGS